MTKAQPDRAEAAVACSLTAADLTQRHDRWLRLGERAGIDTLMTADGLQLVFRAAPEIEDELEQLAALERDCCGFAAWSVHKRGDRLLLAVTADSEEGIAAVQAMFKKLPSSMRPAAANSWSG